MRKRPEKHVRRRFVATLPRVALPTSPMRASIALQDDSRAALVCPQCQSTAYINQELLDFLLGLEGLPGVSRPPCPSCSLPVQIIPLGADLPPPAPMTDERKEEESTMVLRNGNHHAATLTPARPVKQPLPADGDDELLTVPEVAMRLRVDPTTIRRWIKGGQLPAITLPHAHARESYRIRKSTLEQLLKEQ